MSPGKPIPGEFQEHRLWKWIIKSDILKKGYIIHKVELEAK
jgi:hypothetical protein